MFFLVRSRKFRRRDETEAYQYEQLRKLIFYAYENVPYYSNLFRKIGFHPDDFRSIEDLQRIPFLTKQVIRDHQNELISRSIPQKHIKKVSTGGTTGMPMEFLLDKRFATLTEMVFLRHMWRRIGYRQRARCVVLREDNVERIIEGKKYWKRNLLTNWLVMSAFHMNSDTFHLFYNRILSYQPEFILAFPSNAMLLARFIKQNNLPPFPTLKTVICASENLYDWQREYMKEVFQAKIFSYYGHSEKCVLASECPDSESFEFFPQYGFAEIINQEGEPCSKEGERGEIVATGFHNYVTPFIRYKTDDIASFTISAESCHPHWVRINRIEGRKQDFLIDRDRVPKTYMHIDRPFWNIRDKVLAYQYIQDEPGKVFLQIHSKGGLQPDELERIREIFHATYFKFDLKIKEVDHIPRSRSGKFRYLIQNIDPG